VSRARAAADRVPMDAYLTPGPLALEICERQRRCCVDPVEIMEPSAGAGAFVRAARAVWPEAHVTAVDIDPARREQLLDAGAHVVLIQDWALLARRLANEQAEDGPRRLILGNPTYLKAQPHIEAGFEWLRKGDRLAFLLRINFLGSTERVSFWRRPGLQTIAPIAPRPSFGLNKHGKKGTDGTEYAVFTWVKGYRGTPRLQRPIVWKPARGRP
jgi:hypothetical protein